MFDDVLCLALGTADASVITFSVIVIFVPPLLAVAQGIALRKTRVFVVNSFMVAEVRG